MRAAFAAALVLFASPALAHGVEGFLWSLAVAGGVVGAIGGITSAAFRLRVLVGLAVSAGVLVVGELALLFVSMGGSADPLRDVGWMMMLLAVFAAVPLALGFFVVFAVSSMVRNLKRRTP